MTVPLVRRLMALNLLPRRFGEGGKSGAGHKWPPVQNDRSVTKRTIGQSLKVRVQFSFYGCCLLAAGYCPQGVAIETLAVLVGYGYQCHFAL